MSTPTYSIVGWNDIYENSRSRTVKSLDWVPVPNRHDGDGFASVMCHPYAAEIYAAWHLILQVASKCEKRGILVSANGTPYTAESLARKTRGKVRWFEKALEFLSSKEVGWVQIYHELQEGDTQPSGNHQSSDSVVSMKGREENGMNEGKGMESGKPEKAGHPFLVLKDHEGYDILKSVWVAYESHRKEKGTKPYTNVSLESLVSKAQRLSPGKECRLIANCAQRSIDGNWQGIPADIWNEEAKNIGDSNQAQEKPKYLMVTNEDGTVSKMMPDGVTPYG